GAAPLPAVAAPASPAPPAGARAAAGTDALVPARPDARGASCPCRRRSTPSASRTVGSPGRIRAARSRCRRAAESSPRSRWKNPRPRCASKLSGSIRTTTAHSSAARSLSPSSRYRRASSRCPPTWPGLRSRPRRHTRSAAWVFPILRYASARGRKEDEPGSRATSSLRRWRSAIAGPLVIVRHLSREDLVERPDGGQRGPGDLPPLPVAAETEERVQRYRRPRQVAGADRRQAEIEMRVRRQRCQGRGPGQRLRRCTHAPLTGQRPSRQQRELGPVGIRRLQLFGAPDHGLDLAPVQQVLQLTHGPLEVVFRKRRRPHFDLDHAGTHPPVRDLRPVRRAAPPGRRDLAQVLLAVDLRQDLPFLGPEVEDRPVPVTQRRQHRDRMDAGDARLQPRPFVNAPRTLHQQRIDPNLNADPVPLRSVPLLEAEPALRPAHDLVQRLLDLEAQVAPHLLLRHTPHLHENVAEALARVPALQLERAFQLALRDLAGTQQELPQRSPRVP